jgi:Flp pilus assembly protein TadD
MKTKAIVFGKLEFSSEKNYEQALKMCQQKYSTYYKGQTLFRIEQIFDTLTCSFHIPRTIKEDFDLRQWKNTTEFFKYVADFAMAGSIFNFFFKDGVLKENLEIEPVGDKTAIQAFIQGRQAIQTNDISQAIQELNLAITKFEKHATAYERRGYAYYKLGCWNEADADFSKSLSINSYCAKSYYGKSLIAIIKEQSKDAVENLELALKNSIPHQPIFWDIRRVKGNVHLQLKEYDKAAVEYNFYIKRAETDASLSGLKQIYFNYGQCLEKQGKKSEAATAFKKAKLMKGALDAISEAALQQLI